MKEDKEPLSDTYTQEEIDKMQHPEHDFVIPGKEKTVTLDMQIKLSIFDKTCTLIGGKMAVDRSRFRFRHGCYRRLH